MNIRIAGELVAEAELEERERCAKVAEHFFQKEFKRTGEADAPVYRMQTIGLCIAKAIREQK